MILYEIKIKFNINFKIKFHDFKPLLIQPFSISIFLIIQFLNNFEVLKLKHKSDSLKNIFKINWVSKFYIDKRKKKHLN